MGTKGETKEAGDSNDKTQEVTMAMGCLDCPVCYEPLRPPIFQCGIGHVLCTTCRARLNKCPLCSRTAFDRCFCMECVVDSVAVPCLYAKNGCTKKIIYFDKKKHESVCRHRPCFCPDSGCSFTGPAAALLDHFTTHHKWPSKAFKYYEQFDLLVKPSPQVLHALDGNVFLMNMAPAEPLGHTISLVCVQPDPTDSRFGCSVVFSCFAGHHQISTLDAVRSSSLSEGLPKDFFCIVPNASGGRDGVVLRTTIDTELVLDIDDKLEDEEDNENYDKDEDDEADDSDMIDWMRKINL
uniref:RING-type E3 ubiquitin transferase n=1 Tax=Arundo donax TaxID=35708 RepID=A0A0A8Y551_ARUDO